MKTKKLLVLSVVLNAALVGVVLYLFEIVPEPGYAVGGASFSGDVGLSGDSGSTEPTHLTPQFGKVIELSLVTPRWAGGPQLYNLKTGHALRDPGFECFGNNAKVASTWIRANGLDISGVIFDRTNATCICYYMAVVPVASQRWAKMTAADAIADPELIRARNAGRSVISPERNKSDTFLFRTGEGTTGILQMLGATDALRAVKIRYKLFSPPQPTETEVARN